MIACSNDVRRGAITNRSFPGLGLGSNNKSAQRRTFSQVASVIQASKESCRSLLARPCIEIFQRVQFGDTAMFRRAIPALIIALSVAAMVAVIAIYAQPKLASSTDASGRFVMTQPAGSYQTVWVLDTKEGTVAVYELASYWTDKEKRPAYEQLPLVHRPAGKPAYVEK